MLAASTMEALRFFKFFTGGAELLSGPGQDGRLSEDCQQGRVNWAFENVVVPGDLDVEAFLQGELRLDAPESQRRRILVH